MALPKLEECNPGVKPTEYNVLIAPDDTDRKIGSIIIPDSVKEANKMATMQGRLVDVSPLAFNFDAWPDGARKPQPGDKVLFAKFAGVLFDGADKREYRACKDRDVIAVYEEVAQ
jgi:chaperonin GroES